jgi:hypothetical protein
MQQGCAWRAMKSEGVLHPIIGSRRENKSIGAAIFSEKLHA